MKKLLYFTSYVDGSIPFMFSDIIQDNLKIDVVLMEWEKEGIREYMESSYDYIYIRDPFTDEKISEKEAQEKVQIILENKKDAYMVDGVEDIEIVLQEDKWIQYKKWGEFMAQTHILQDGENVDFQKNLIKKSLSTRGRDIYFSRDSLSGPSEKYIVQERIPMIREHRVYAIFDKIIDVSSMKSPKTETQKVKVIGSQKISEKLMSFVRKVHKRVDYDFIGYDIAETKDGEFVLIEINRGPLFTKFYEQTGRNLAEDFVEELLKRR